VLFKNSEHQKAEFSHTKSRVFDAAYFTPTNPSIIDSVDRFADRFVDGSQEMNDPGPKMGGSKTGDPTHIT
jgi:hypothetical protein